MSKKNNDLVKHLNVVLATSYACYLKTQNFHWNVSGPNFNGLHALFQTQYEDLALAIDELAERIKAIGGYAIGGFGEYKKLSSINDAANKPISTTQMVKELSKDQAKLADLLNATIEVSQSVGDEATTDMLIGRLKVHQKNKWMLDSSL